MESEDDDGVSWCVIQAVEGDGKSNSECKQSLRESVFETIDRCERKMARLAQFRLW
jgi:hypothetical protein